MSTTPETKQLAREKLQKIAAEFNERGDRLGWFDEVYRQAAGDIENIPWADLEPNRFLREWAEKEKLDGKGRRALVVGCGLGDDAKFLHDLGFTVTAFDISPTAVEWARKIYGDTDIQFETADLFDPPAEWLANGSGAAAHARGFDFVLEIYTIQPLPMELRSRAIESVASFVAPGGELLVICRGRDDDEQVGEIPYPLSKSELGRFEAMGLEKLSFDEMVDEQDGDTRRFIVHYRRRS